MDESFDCDWCTEISSYEDRCWQVLDHPTDGDGRLFCSIDCLKEWIDEFVLIITPQKERKRNEEDRNQNRSGNFGKGTSKS